MPCRLHIHRSLGQRKSRRPRWLLHVEPLEDRTLLAVITVNTDLDQNSQTDTTLSLREAIEVADGTLPITLLEYRRATSGQRLPERRAGDEHDRVRYPFHRRDRDGHDHRWKRHRDHHHQRW